MVGDGSQRNSDALGAAPARSRRRAAWAVVALVALAGAGIAYWWWSPKESAEPGISHIDEGFVDAAAANPGYVGAEACTACHAARVERFRATRHFRACCAPEAKAIAPGFAVGRGAHPTQAPGLRFEMTANGGDFLQTGIQTTPSGEKTTSARIALVYGARGGGDEMYFTWHGDRLHELPMGWLYPFDRWGNTSLNPHGSGDFSRTTTPRCVECHNTWIAYVAGTPNEYKGDTLIMGVTCERCHGPGREHVAYHRGHPETVRGQAIVQPDRLSRERQLEVCTQCHSNAIKHRAPPFSYRPGQPLDEYFRTLESKVPEHDHVANQIQYLRQSKCFQKSETMTCTTCHDPHRPNRPETVQRACLECHRPADCGDHARLPAAVRDHCVACHMPQRVWMNVFFHTQDDQYVPPIRRFQHRIAVDPTARQEVLLAWHRTQSDAASGHEAARLSRALLEHWLSEADTCRREYRYMAAIGALREALRIDAAPATRKRLQQAVALQAKLDADCTEAFHQIEQRRLPQATEMLERILQVKPDLVGIHGRLGTLYAAAGKRDRAVEHFHAVAKYDANDPYGHNMLGWLAYLDDRAEEAVAAYRRAVELEPFSAEINYRMGLALMKARRLPEAVKTFRTVLTIDPQHAGGSQGLSHALRQQGQPAEAVRFAQRAARLTRFENADVLLTLAETYADAGRFVHADDAAAKALLAAEQTDPRLVALIRQRQEEIRARGKPARE